MTNMRTAVIFPTYNAEATLGPLLDSIQQQTLKPDHILAIDSSPSNTSIEILKKYNIDFYSIKDIDFNHGTTRQLAVSLINADIYIFLTQDITLVNKYAFENLLQAFVDEKVGCAYGRQLPQKDADLLAKHVRLFFYPEVSSIKTYNDRSQLGIKTCFNSNNFAAYKKNALLSVGGFPKNIIFCEDMYVAAKMLINGWKVVYKADAMIYHSHNYTLQQEFKRYFDTGAFHAMNPWVLIEFPVSVKEATIYLRSILLYCIKQKKYLVALKALIITLVKYLGFFIGKHYDFVPLPLRTRFSMYKHWQN